MIRHKQDRKIILGIAPVRRDTFSPEPARILKGKIMERTEKLSQKLGDIELVSIDEIIEGGMLWFHQDCEKVADFFRTKKVDAVFFPHCNFGQEEVVAKVAKALDKPVLLWGPRDPDPSEDKSGKTGPRAYDTQCGLFATARALNHYNVPFTYIENCWLDSSILDEEFEKFIRVVSVVKAFKGMRIGQLGTRPRQFLTVKVNEAELLSRFGIEVVPVWPDEVIAISEKLQRGMKPEPTGTEITFQQLHWEPADPRDKDPRLDEIVKEIKETMDTSQITDENLEKIAIFELAVLTLAEINKLDAIAVDCWGFPFLTYGINTCFVLGDLFDRGLPSACETDIHAAIGAILLQAAARYASPAFVADLTIRHPFNENAELLWHCGPFAKSLKKKGVIGGIKDEKGMFEIEGGDLTLVRFDQDNGRYMLFADEGEGTDGPATTGNYVWFQANDWVKWEKKLIYGPYIHHVTGIHGHYANILKEACKYMESVTHDSVEAVVY